MGKSSGMHQHCTHIRIVVPILKTNKRPIDSRLWAGYHELFSLRIVPSWWFILSPGELGLEGSGAGLLPHWGVCFSSALYPPQSLRCVLQTWVWIPMLLLPPLCAWWGRLSMCLISLLCNMWVIKKIAPALQVCHEDQMQ